MLAPSCSECAQRNRRCLSFKPRGGGTAAIVVCDRVKSISEFRRYATVEAALAAAPNAGHAAPHCGVHICAWLDGETLRVEIFDDRRIHSRESEIAIAYPRQPFHPRVELWPAPPSENPRPLQPQEYAP